MRYMNPGFKDWFSVIGDSSSLTETTDTSKTKTGIAFYNTKAFSNYIQFDYPANKEIWVKFDFYAGSSFLYFGEPYNSSYRTLWNGLYFYFNGATTDLSKYVGGNNYSVKSFNNLEKGLKINAVNSALLHFKWADSTNGFMDLQINNYVFDRIEDVNLTPLHDRAKISFETSSNKNSISNVIISDEEISIKEQIVELPITSIQSDMTFDSDTEIYTAIAANQSLLASVNVADLIGDFGSTSKVTGVTMVGNPAYRTAEGLSSLTSISKKNNTVTEYGAVNIPTDSNTVVTHSFNVATDTTIADLQSMQLGWKVGG